MIPIHRPRLGFWNYVNLNKCIYENWVSSGGPYVKEFEDKFAKYCGVKYAVACNGGTSALHLGLLSMGCRKHNKVLIPAFTMAATAFAVEYIGAEIVLADVDAYSWGLDETNLIKDVHYVIPVHMYGKINRPLVARNIYIMEDACEAHGATRGGRAGSFGSCAAFSFYANKVITTGEGGMLCTNDKMIDKQARWYRDMCFGPTEKLIHTDIGYNYRMTNLQAAVGVAQLGRIDGLLKIKRRIAQWYTDRLLDIDDIQLPPASIDGDNIYWMYGIVFKNGIKYLIKDHLKDKGIETRDFFCPMHWQPCFKDRFQGDNYPVSEWLYENGLLLPSGYDLTEEDVDLICNEIKRGM